MSALESKPIRTLLRDGSILTEVVHRLQEMLATYPSNPAEWTPVQDARVQMAIKLTLKAIHHELEARPGLVLDESMLLDVLLGQGWVNAVMTRLHERGGAL